MGGIGVVTNPRSRRNRRNPHLWKRLAYILGQEGDVALPKDIDALHRSIEHFRDAGIDVLAINGGDGTNHVVLSALVEIYGDAPLPKLALLRGGTMNTVASGLGVRGDPDVLLGRLVTRYHAGEPMRVAERNLMVIDGHHAGFLFGAGLIYNFLDAYYEGREPSPVKAAWLLLRAIGSSVIQGSFIKRLMKPLRCEVVLDGQRWDPEQWLTIGAGTVDDIGLGFRAYPRSVDHPGYLEAVGFTTSPLDIVSQLRRVYRGKPIRHPRARSDLAREMVLRADEDIGYFIDGDMHMGGDELVVRAGPRVSLVL